MKSELVPAIIVVLLLLVFLNPFNLFMPPTFVMILLVTLIVLFGVFAALIWREKPIDEREVLLSQKAGRTAFLVGTTVLVIGIVYEELYHALDSWLIYALVFMIMGKIVGYWYIKRNN